MSLSEEMIAFQQFFTFLSAVNYNHNSFIIQATDGHVLPGGAGVDAVVAPAVKVIKIFFFAIDMTT